jgi:hypothetical protein
LDRDRLAICVQPVAGAGVTPQEARSLVEGALSAVAQHPNWAPAGLAIAAPTTEIGCPTGPQLLQPGVAFDGKASLKNGERSTPQVARASRFRAFVFILPDGQSSQLFANTARRTAAQEILCAGKVCAEVTTGLYLSPPELRDPQVLRAALERAIGLEPAVPFEAPTRPQQR